MVLRKRRRSLRRDRIQVRLSPAGRIPSHGPLRYRHGPTPRQRQSHRRRDSHRYRRVPCPKLGNIYIWLHDGAGPYYFALSAVNTNGPGSVTSVEVQAGGSGPWIALEHDPNYTSSRPQERYGSWVLPQGKGPITAPVAMRLTAPDGKQVVKEGAITSFTPPATAVKGFWYIDLGCSLPRKIGCR
ncbi:putative swollenin [Aspergillus novofumigatus IBT 16806]|uniref:Expansin-like CBD domain-containing protein n=1 Tax=Aspergillus novofumigatus (strain IBT 16806) TaxID=1392255 RepID=A0A2I1CED7_ASPN1|nr:uncharacterized protein P174DRAFT_482970 [Aspergillus novofumigatus IBT 16806]PKX95989.1 hypothetical protein P174DRAFT_482970 [Aspergillus novofumigatus IBT 16806]